MSVCALEILESAGVNYAVLHDWDELPDHLSSDLDIVLAPEDLPRLEEALLRAAGPRVVQVIQHEATSFYFVLAVEEEKGVRFLPVDVTTDYRRNGRVWFTAKELLQGRRRWKTFWVVAPGVEFRYLLVKKLLKAEVPARARKRLQALVTELGAGADELAQGLLGKRWGKNVNSWVRAGHWERFEGAIGRLRRALLWRKLWQEPLNLVRYWVPELQRIWRRWKYRSGLFVAVLGPDGAGKSTLIQHLQNQLQGAFRRTALYHFRPRLLEAKDDSRPVSKPHDKPPRPLPVILLKLAYYWFDYTFGYLLKVRPKVARSTLVLFDRYYHDLLVDPRRYRHRGAGAVTRLVGDFVPKPDLFIILNVRGEVSYVRKPEVPPEETNRLRECYQALTLRLSGAIPLDANLPSDQVSRCAESVILEVLHQRYLKRRAAWFPQARRKDGLKELEEALATGERSGRRETCYLHFSLPDGRGYLLPQNSPAAAVAGLSLYPAQKLHTKVLRKFFTFGLKIGFIKRLMPQVSLDLGHFTDFLMEILCSNNLLLAISLGTPGPHRKPVIQVTSDRGEVLGYVKIGWNQATQSLVQNEANVLKLLHSQDFPCLFPQLLFAGQWNCRLVCVQSPPPAGAHPGAQKMAPLYLEALRALAQIGLRYCLLEETQFWQRIEERRRQVSSPYWAQILDYEMEISRKAFTKEPVLCHLSHGDFTPWNAFQVEGKPYLIDWEYAMEAPAGYDFFHFRLQTSWLVERSSPCTIAERMVRHARNFTAQDYWNRFRVDEKSILRLLRLYLIDRLSLVCVIEPSTSESRHILLSILQRVQSAG